MLAPRCVVLCCAGADRAQDKMVADTQRPIAIPTEQEAVAPEAFPNPSEVRGKGGACCVAYRRLQRAAPIARVHEAKLPASPRLTCVKLLTTAACLSLSRHHHHCAAAPV